MNDNRSSEPPRPSGAENAAGAARGPRSPAPVGGEGLLMTLVSAGMFLYVGFALNLRGISDSAVYNASVSVFTIGSKVIGVGLLAVAGLIYFRLRFALHLDFILATLAAVGCAVVGIVWLVHNDNSGILLLLFALLNGSAARGAWAALRGA